MADGSGTEVLTVGQIESMLSDILILQRTILEEVRKLAPLAEMVAIAQQNPMVASMLGLEK